MSDKQFAHAVVPGRMELFTMAHSGLIQRGFEVADRVAVVLGSAFRSREAKNPFTWEERASMIRLTLSTEQVARVSFVPVRDYHNDDRWLTAVKAGVEMTLGKEPNTAVVGYRKDPTSAYLDKMAQAFKPWSRVEGPVIPGLNATALRKIYFEQPMSVARELFAGKVHPAVIDYLAGWRELGHFERLREEHLEIEEEKRQWAGSPFAPTFNTADALLRSGDYLLLIRRKHKIGHGLWAIPGLHVGERETHFQAAVRALEKEAGIGLHELVLEKGLKSVVCSGHPDRSQRGRVFTQLHEFEIGEQRDTSHLPLVGVTAAAMETAWVHKRDLLALESEFFEDHFLMLDHLYGLTPPH